jgi:hypothetical protein
MSEKETTEEKFKRGQPLKTCDRCKKPSEPQGGVEMKTRWFCARCWISYLNAK